MRWKRAAAAPSVPDRPATPPSLRYVTDDRPGIRRVGRGTGFSYHRPDGDLVARETRARIEALVIPPAWTDVWICPGPNGHLQATGRDAKGRKQYRYHADWSAHRNRLKYDRMVPFGEALSGLRERVDRDLRKQGLGLDTVAALCVRLLDETLIRVGNEQYKDQSFGLTTLRDRHATVDGATVRFAFTGKSGKAQELEVSDRRLARLVRACRDIPGYDLFQFYDADGARHDIESGHVNTYLHEATGDAFTAKDFRTWGGTILAAETLAALGDPADDAAADDGERAAIRAACDALGNTEAVCRRYYVHPDVLGAWRDGHLADRVRRRNAGNTPAGLKPSEAAVLDLLRAKG